MGIMLSSAVITVVMVLPVLLCRRDAGTSCCLQPRGASTLEPPALPHPSAQTLAANALSGMGSKKHMSVGHCSPCSAPDAQDVMIPAGVAALDVMAAVADAIDVGKEHKQDGSSGENTTVSIIGRGAGGAAAAGEDGDTREAGVADVGVMMGGVAAALRRAELHGMRLSHAAILEAFSGAVLQPYMWVTSASQKGGALCVQGVTNGRRSRTRGYGFPFRRWKGSNGCCTCRG